VTFHGLKSAANRIREQGNRYLRSFVWLVRESLRVAPRQWRRIVIATGFSLASNAAVVGSIYLYVRLVERNPTLELWGYTLIPRESVLLLGAFVGSVLGGLLVFAVSDYIARTASLRMHRLYQEEATRQTLHLMRHLPDPRAAAASVLLEGVGLRRYYGEYPRSCGWTMRFIGNAIPSLAVFLGAYATLLWLDPGTTLMVTLLGLAVVAAQYPANLFAATASNLVDETRGYYAARLAAVVDAVDRSAGGPAQDALAERIDRLYDDPQVIRYETANEDRYRALEISALSMQTGGALVLAVILFTIAGGIIADSGNWAVLVVYATLLRQLLSSATGVFRAVTMFSRFSPHIQAYRGFVVAASQAAEKTAETVPSPEQLRLAAYDLDGVAGAVTLRRGERFVLVSRGAVGRSLALSLQRAAVLARPSGEKDSYGDYWSHEALAGLPRIRPVAIDPGESANDPGSAAPGDPGLPPVLERALTEGVDMLLISCADFASLGLEPEHDEASRLADCCLGLVCFAIPEGLEPGALVLVTDRAKNLHWCRVPQDGLTDDLSRALQQRLDVTPRRGGQAPTLDDEFD
jgi:hypothetical protein